MTQGEVALRPLDAFLRSYGIKHFRAHELVSEADQIVPSREDWWHILPTLHTLERLREDVGPITVLSGWRSRRYNAQVGGALNSLHTVFNAIDWRPVDFQPWEIPELEALVDEFTGSGQCHGIGVYADRHPDDDYKAGFIHLDTRSLVFGMPPARWYGESG